MEANEYGGGILPPELKNNVQQDFDNGRTPNVRLVRLAKFLREVVGARKVPKLENEDRKPTVLMKIDIEGSEIEVIPDILFSGGLGVVNGLMVEFHERLEKLEARKAAHAKLESVLQQLSEFSKSMSKHGGQFNFTMHTIDDETYGTSRFPLPKCWPQSCDMYAKWNQLRITYYVNIKIWADLG